MEWVMGDGVDTPKTVLITRAPAVLKTSDFDVSVSGNKNWTISVWLYFCIPIVAYRGLALTAVIKFPFINLTSNSFGSKGHWPRMFRPNYFFRVWRFNYAFGLYSDLACLIHDLAAAKQVLRELCFAKMYNVLCFWWIMIVIMTIVLIMIVIMVMIITIIIFRPHLSHSWPGGS